MKVIEDGVEVTKCEGCGDYLNDVEWNFDPCPADDEGHHRQAAEVRS
jgi:hypothetical protein